MDIKGFQEVTLIDWDGKIASIIFLGGCNLRCGFCHSSSLAIASDSLETIPFERINKFLKAKKGWIDGVVITGGEPMLDKAGLFELVKAIKRKGFLVKVDTNGTKPEALREIIESKLVDYIAMDIKAPFSLEKYVKAAGIEIEIDDIIASKNILLNSEMDYEFRTTAVPGIVDCPDIEKIAKTIIGAKKYCLQQFVPRDPIDIFFRNIKPYPADKLHQMVSVASEYLPSVVLKNN
jgi:pyruvate formate lyase activating enzyme